MPNSPYQSYTSDSPANESSADASPDGNSLSNADAENGISPLGALGSSEDRPSPWSASSTGSGYDSLTLPPINPDNNYDDELPSFNDSHYFDALPRLSSPNPFLPEHSNSRTPNTRSQPRSRESQNEQAPPPSNQQARHPAPPISQYRFESSESPDPFDDFFDLSLPPGDMNPRSNRSTRQSSFIDLTESSPVITNTMAPSRKRKAAEPGEGRAKKVARPSSSKSSRSTPARAAKREGSEAVPLVDLVDVDNVTDYEALRAKEQADLIKRQNQEAATKPVKLAEFQCIICMDNPTDLTVTFCGHLFCSECLHQALYAGDKKCCPVCRSQIGAPKSGGKQPKNGVFALEMKFMTAKKKGKQAVRN